MKVAIIDYGSGNVFSVESAIKRLGGEAILTANQEVINSADKVIFPGVGHAKYAMEQLKSSNLDVLIPALKQPVLGICLGMQLMCDFTEEGNVNGLNIFKDIKVKKFEDVPKIPHIGWNSLKNGVGIFENCTSDVYFVHSYFVELNKFTSLETDYGQTFSAALQKDNFYACQFHPEKSGKVGETILSNFIKL
jgi:glutamine amidotransferase